MQNAAENPITHIEGVINYTRELNSDLRSLVNRIDTLCNRMGRSAYTKNHPMLESSQAAGKSQESDGLLDDMQTANNIKATLINELRTGVEYLEQHI